MAQAQIVSSLVKAIEVLKSVSGGVNGVSDIARSLGYDKTTVYRILNTYEQQGVVIKDPESRLYYPGPFLQSLALDPTRIHKWLIARGRDAANLLSRDIGESVAIQVPFGALRYMLYAVHSEKNFLYHTNVGSMGPIYTGAAGKVLLSQMDDVELSSLLERVKLVPITEFTTTDRTALLAEIQMIRKQGFEVTYGEYQESGVAVAVPVRGYTCPISLSTVGPRERMEHRIDLIVEKLNSVRSVIEDGL